MHVGATIITQWKNYDFYTRDVLNYAPLPPRATPANRALLGHVERLGLDVETIVPIHGLPVAWSDFTRLGELGR